MIIIGVPVICYGVSGAGKSRSLKNFAEDEILLVNVERKPLPFRKKLKYTIQNDNVDFILGKLKNMHKAGVRTAVIDDATYIMTRLFMSKHRNMKGNASFDMYNEIADAMYNLVESIKWELPEDAVVYIMLHEDVDTNGRTKLKTLGKLLDDKCMLEGMVTIALRFMSADGKHFVRTVTDGYDITKAPEEMFNQPEVDNDLKAIDTVIREYWGLVEKVEVKE